MCAAVLNDGAILGENGEHKLAKSSHVWFYIDDRATNISRL